MALNLLKTFVNGSTATYWKLNNIRLESPQDPTENGMLYGRELSEEETARIASYATNKLKFNISCNLDGYVSETIRTTKNIKITSESFNFNNVDITSEAVTTEDNLQTYLYKQIKLQDSFSTATDC